MMWELSIYINPKDNYFLDNRKPLSKPSQDPLSFVMLSKEINKINFASHLSEEKRGKPQKNHRNPFRSRIESIKCVVQKS